MSQKRTASPERKRVMAVVRPSTSRAVVRSLPPRLVNVVRGTIAEHRQAGHNPEAVPDGLFNAFGRHIGIEPNGIETRIAQRFQRRIGICTARKKNGLPPT